MLHFLRFIVSKVFLINLLIALLLLSAGLFAILQYLDDYTLHSKTITVPNIVDVHISEVDTLIAGEDEFSAIVSDSVYQKGKASGVVVEQNPAAGTTVKRGRKIYVTISTSEPPKVSMPDLVDMSRRQAISLLETFGLELGELIYKPDLCRDCILEQLVNGEEIEKGERVKRGIKIDLVVGAGLGNELTPVPYLTGTTAQVAEDVLKSKSLNIGGKLYDETVLTKEDSAAAQVYKQMPPYSEAPAVRMGSAVDIFLTMDTNRVVHTVNPSDSL